LSRWRARSDFKEFLTFMALSLHRIVLEIDA
jgi:hypothetical protein